jgi:hypothetical protein
MRLVSIKNSKIRVERAVEYVVYPPCSKLKINSPIVSDPLDHSNEETVSSVNVVIKTRKAPLSTPENRSGSII